MKRIRVWVQADYEFEDGAELVDVRGEKAIRVGGKTLQPSLDFSVLKEVTETSSIWEPATEETFEMILSAEKQLSVDLVEP